MAQALSVHDVARYFLAKQNGGDISNLKLQKLCYYAQALSLAVRGKPLWVGYRIKAWKHGPVIPDVYKRYEEFSWHPIPRVADLDEGRYDAASRELLDSVFASFGRLPATTLRDMTHAEQPWKAAFERAEAGGDNVITDAAMRTYFVGPEGSTQPALAKAVWSYLRATLPDWDGEAERARAEIAKGKGLSLEELRRQRGL